MKGSLLSEIRLTLGRLMFVCFSFEKLGTGRHVFINQPGQPNESLETPGLL